MNLDFIMLFVGLLISFAGAYVIKYLRKELAYSIGIYLAFIGIGIMVTAVFLLVW